MSGGSEREPSIWPERHDPADPELIDTKCGSCGAPWRIHPCMEGFRLRCHCGEWMVLPSTRNASSEHLLEPRESSSLAERAETGLARQGKGRAGEPPAELQGIRAWHGGPLDREPDGTWSLRHAENRVRQRWISSTVIEIVLVMVGFLLPPLVLALTVEPERLPDLLPISSLVVSILVVAVLYFRQPHYVTSGLVLPRPRYFAEGLLACGVAIGFGVLYVSLLDELLPGIADPQLSPLRERIGWPMALVVVSLCPGIFEELAFRGLIQGRITTLMGPSMGVVVSGTAFALGHGITLGFPLHAGIGIYLAWLRLRSGSLYPGILLHMGYNAFWVLTE